jgi:hypothetical protein
MDLGHDAGAADPPRQLVDPESLQPLTDVVRRLILFEAELGRGVQFASISRTAGGGFEAIESILSN